MEPNNRKSGASGMERVTISSFEDHARRSRRSDEYTTRRSRKRARQEQLSSKWLWLVLAGIVAVYVLFLGYHVVSGGAIAPQTIEVPPSVKSVEEERDALLLSTAGHHAAELSPCCENGD